MNDSNLPFLVDGSGNEYELNTATVSLGRTIDNQIVLANDSVSRHHALIVYSNGQFTLRDLGSKNGTRINGEFITAEQPIANGDKLTIGDVKLTFRLSAETETRTLTHLSNTNLPSPQSPAIALRLDIAAMEVHLHGQILEPALSPLEWKLLVLLYQNHGKVCSRDLIIETLYQNPDPDLFDSAIETVVSRLRKRLQMFYPDQLPYIKVVRGVGYKLDL